MIVQVVSIIGVIVISTLVLDAYRDRQLVKDNGEDQALLRETATRIVNMWVMWLLEAIFLVSALIFGYVERPSALRDLALWMLISLPIIIMVWAIWLSHRRRLELILSLNGNGGQRNVGKSDVGDGDSH